ncbi:MAG: hypothetical protein J5697_00880, partial [Clostridia bacterium]|nr:hypothetical protein [Clostridia bacterium]
MKKAYVKILSLILSLLMVLLYTATLTGCKASEGSVDIEIPLVGKTEITMSVGDERIIPANFDDLEYESSDESILTVDANGKMTA